MLDRLWRILVTGIDDPITARHRREVLDVLVIAMLVVFAGNSIWRKSLDAGYQVPWPAYAILLVVLFLNRRGFSITASIVVVLLVPAFVASSFLIGPAQRGPLAVMFLIIGPVLASTLIGGPATVITGLINMVLLAVLQARVPAIAATGVVEAMILLTGVVTLLLIFSLRARTRVETARDAALIESNVRMGMMLESAMDAVITLDASGKVVDANPAAVRILGYQRQELVGHEMAERIIPERDRAAHRAGFKRAVETGHSQLAGRRLEMRALHRDGSELPIELTIGAAQLPTGPMFTGFIRDLTEREEAAARHAALEEQLRQSQKMQAIGQLAGGIAHDFNNMLQVISGFLAMAIDDLKGRVPGSVADLQQAAQAADRASDLTRRLLTFSRHQFLALEVVDFNEALTASLTLVQRALGEHIELEFHPGDHLPTVKLDRGQFQQVVLNLCLNARDAMPDGGRLILETELVDVPVSFVTDHPWARAGTYVAMVVADSGTGMTPEVAARIFEPFFTTKDVGGGTGLGLAVVYGIVQQHRGFIRVDTSPGEGTSFRLYWPVSGELATRTETTEAPIPSGGTETILVAEDADAIREYIARTLSGAGYRVITAANGKEAVARLAEDPARVDLVVLDMVMPKVSGRAAFETMRRTRPDLRGIFLSGYAADELSEVWLAEHQCALLAKPIASRTLLRRVREALDR